MPRVSKKRKFKGTNRWTVQKQRDESEGHLTGESTPVEASSGSDDEVSFVGSPETSTASEKKLKTRKKSPDEAYYTAPSDAKSYRLVELSSLMKSFQELHSCKGGKLILNEDQARTYGNSSLLSIDCSKCKKKVYLQTSGNNCERWNPTSAIDVNRRMVYSAFEIGIGREAVATLCEIFNMPPPCSKNSWDKHSKVLFEAHKTTIESRLKEARQRVVDH